VHASLVPLPSNRHPNQENSISPHTGSWKREGGRRRTLRKRRMCKEMARMLFLFCLLVIFAEANSRKLIRVPAEKMAAVSSATPVRFHLSTIAF